MLKSKTIYTFSSACCIMVKLLEKRAFQCACVIEWVGGVCVGCGGVSELGGGMSVCLRVSVWVWIGVCVHACVSECMWECVVSGIVNPPPLTPCAVDGHSRNTLHHCYHEQPSGRTVFVNLWQKSLVTATTTRRKQQQEMIRLALLAEEERKRVGRENFPMTTVAVPQLAAYEPALHPAVEEHEEGSHLVLWAVCFFRETENLSQAWGGGVGVLGYLLKGLWVMHAGKWWKTLLCDIYSPWDKSSIAVDLEFMDFQGFQVLTRKSCTFLESEELLLVELPFCCSCLCGYMFNLAFLAYLWNLWSLCRHFLRLVLPWFSSGCVRFEIHILSQAMVPVKQEGFCCCWSFSRVLPNAASMFSQTVNKMCYIYIYIHTHKWTMTFEIHGWERFRKRCAHRQLSR